MKPLDSAVNAAKFRLSPGSKLFKFIFRRDYYERRRGRGGRLITGEYFAVSKIIGFIFGSDVVYEKTLVYASKTHAVKRSMHNDIRHRTSSTRGSL